MSDSDSTSAPKKVPVTVITGFLGSGKTTLLNYILTANHGKRIAVIENEFGDQVGIEKLIAKDGKGGVVDMDDLFVEVSNGCICCAVKDDLVTTIERLLEKRSKFDYILLETSGLADPGPIASVFWLDDELESSIFLDAIVTVVDAQNLEKNLLSAAATSQENSTPGKETLNEAYRQLAYADKVILNKRDLVTESQLDHIRTVVNEINPLVETVTSEFGNVSLEDILDVAAFDPDTTRLRVEELATIATKLKLSGNPTECASDCEHENHSHAGNHHHDDSIQSVSIEFEGRLKLTEFNRWLGSLLWEDDEQGSDGSGKEKTQYFRIKGIVSVEDSAKLHIVQGVHESFDVYESKQPCNSDNPVARIVFIGRYLNKEFLQNSVKQCISSVADES